jgi:flagellar biosynthesis/type III secretory pathway protein FliH
MIKSSISKDKQLVLSVNPKDVSVVIGQKKSNLSYIKNKYSLDKIRVIQDSDVRKGSIVLKHGKYMNNMSKNDYYNTISK